MGYKLPFPPSIWQAYYRKSNYDTKSDVYKDFELEAYEALRNQGFTLKEHDMFKITILFSRKNWRIKCGRVRKTDLDNYLKCSIDTITSYLKDRCAWFDDSLIFEIHAKKHYGDEDCMFFKIVPIYDQITTQ